MRIKHLIITFILALSVVFFYSKDAKAAEQVTVNSFDELTQNVSENVKNYTDEFEVVYTGNMSNFQQAARQILPQIIDEDDMVAGTLKSYKQTVKSTSKQGAIAYELTYFTSKSKDEAADKLIDAQIKKIKKTAKTDFAKVKAVNDFIVSNTTYGGTSSDRYTAYGLMKNKVAVCQGYALVAYKMFEKLDIPVRYVVGYAGNQNHAWNKVKVSGKWYNLDTTWNDPTPNSPTEVQYNYFLVSDKQLSKDHTWQKSNYPTASSTKYDVLANASSAVLVGNKFYYANKKDNEKLYSFDIKTNAKKKVANVRVQYLVYAKSKLFFSNYSNGAYIYSIKTSGKSLKQWNKKNSSYLSVKSSYLYYKIGSKNYKMKIS